MINHLDQWFLVKNIRKNGKKTSTWLNLDSQNWKNNEITKKNLRKSVKKYLKKIWTKNVRNWKI